METLGPFKRICRVTGVAGWILGAYHLPNMLATHWSVNNFRLISLGAKQVSLATVCQARTSPCMTLEAMASNSQIQSCIRRS